MDFRLLANPLFRFALSEWCLVVFLGAAWISPETIESIYPGFIACLPMLYVAEFILGHATVGFAMPLQFDGTLRVLLTLVVITLYAGFFVILFLLGNALQIGIFLWITLSRFYRADVSFRENGNNDDRERLAARLAIPSLLRIGFLIVCTLVASALPLPQIGLARYFHVNTGWSGRFVDHPEILIFLLMLYFACITWLERSIFPRITRLYDR